MSNHIQNLANLFAGNKIIKAPINSCFFRGCWLPQQSFSGGNWFSEHLDDAAQYIEMHASSGNKQGYRPFIFEGQANKDLEFIELQQSHIAAFEKAYNREWSHSELTTDIPKVFFELNLTSLTGFMRPQTKEYFMCNPVAVLNQKKVWADEQALAEATRVKGFIV